MCCRVSRRTNVTVGATVRSRDRGAILQAALDVNRFARGLSPAADVVDDVVNMGIEARGVKCGRGRRGVR